MQLKRQNFEIIKKGYNAQAKGGLNPRLTESTLFLWQSISANKSQYVFDPLENASQAADELRLNINDEFTVTQFGVFLYGKVQDQANASDTKQLLTEMPFELLAAGQSLKAANLWAGAADILVNNIKYVEKYDLRKHNMAGFGRLTTNGNTAFDFSKDGMDELAPMVTLSGAKKNQININLPDSLASFTFNVVGATQTMTYTIDKIAVVMRGLNAQNAAKFQG